MPMSSAQAQAAGRIGGLRRAALAANPQTITKAAREGRWQKYRQQILDVLPELEGDEAEIMRRSELLFRADMTRMSMQAQEKRRQAAAIEAALQAELDATGLPDSGSDGVDL
jgi:hypothetical protein